MTILYENHHCNTYCKILFQLKCMTKAACLRTCGTIWMCSWFSDIISLSSGDNDRDLLLLLLKCSSIKDIINWHVKLKFVLYSLPKVT
jgi:hypothetical protein